MAKAIKRETIHAGGIDIGIYTTDFMNEFISLTDIAKYRSIDPRVTIHNWLRGRDVVEFLHNPDFKRIDFDTFKENAGSNAFVFSIKDWTEKLDAIGLFTKSGRYGGDMIRKTYKCYSDARVTTAIQVDGYSLEAQRLRACHRVPLLAKSVQRGYHHLVRALGYSTFL